MNEIVETYAQQSRDEFERGILAAILTGANVRCDRLERFGLIGERAVGSDLIE